MILISPLNFELIRRIHQARWVLCHHLQRTWTCLLALQDESQGPPGVWPAIQHSSPHQTSRPIRSVHAADFDPGPSLLSSSQPERGNLHPHREFADPSAPASTSPSLHIYHLLRSLSQRKGCCICHLSLLLFLVQPKSSLSRELVVSGMLHC